MYDVPRPRWRQRFLPRVRCVLLAYLAGSLCFAWWPSRPTRLVRNAGRTYQLLPTKKLEQERALLTQPVHREVAPGVFNPLLDELNGIPRLEKVRSEHLVSAVDLVLEQFQSDLRRIQSSLYKKMALQQQRLSYEEVLGPVEILLDRVEKVWGAIHFLRRAWRISPKIDEIYHQLSYRLSTAASILAQSDFLHEALRQLSEQDLSPVQRRVVMRLAREGFTMGVGIEDPKTLRSLEEGTKRLAQLATVFSQNVAQDEEQVLLRASRDEIKGLSQKVLNVLNTGDGEEFWLTSQREACEAYGRDAENADVRRKAFLAARRLGSGNLPVIAEMLRIRQDWAAVLGYRNFADLVFEARSASKAEVEMLLQALRESSEAAAVEELKDLKTFADEDLRVWDIDHVRSKMKQAEFEEAQLEPYLPLTGVIRGLFKLIERLFNVRLETATSRREVPLWHRSIRFYRVVDVDSQHPIAGLYLDLFQHGKKLRSGGFWSDSFVSFSKRLGNNQDVRRPIAHIVGDLPPPADGPNLLSLREVRSLFNAAGGALQHLLNQQEEGLASPENMEMDAALLPNFMEQWAMDPSTLQSFGGHWETGEVIPDHLLQAMKAQAKHGALDLFQKVSWAQLDLELHSQDLSEDGIDGILEVARAQLASEEIASVLPDFNDAVEEGLCNFHGPFSTGFAAGEYVRIWKEVLVADLFEAFQNQDGDVSTGKRMRELFLAPGADVSPTALVRELRGRGPKVGPFLKQLGLSRLKVLRLASVTHMKMSCPQMSADVNSLG